MNAPLEKVSLPVISADVKEFANARGIEAYLNPVIALARRAFPSSTIHVSFGQDAEDETHNYIAIDIESGEGTADELVAGQHIWSSGIRRVCPANFAVYFVLGWQ